MRTKNLVLATALLLAPAACDDPADPIPDASAAKDGGSTSVDAGAPAADAAADAAASPSPADAAGADAAAGG